MTDEEIESMNAKIEVLFEQIDNLSGQEREKADDALIFWKSAKVSEFFGLGPMTARHEYRIAYEALRGLGLEVGGMLPPYDPEKMH